MSQPAPPALDWGTGAYERTAAQLLPAAELLVELADVQPGERVLDLGCGTGSAALLAAARGAQVIAVDPSERLLGVTRDTASARDLEVVALQGDAAAIPVPDGSVDCLLSSFALVFAPDADVAVAEIARVLADGGRAAFSAWIPGGAVGSCAAAARALVMEALGAPAPPPGLAWHDEVAVTGVAHRHGLAVSQLGTGQVVFSADSPDAYLDAELASHPMAVSGFQLLRQLGRAELGRATLLEVLARENEDPSAFRATSRYVVFGLRRGAVSD